MVDGAKINPDTYTGSVKAKPVVREDDCVGCNLCSLVCPVDECISMIEVPSQRDSVTWGQIMKDKAEITTDWEAMKEYREKVGIDIH
jgi:dihydropyrimidine dehydrogenase (NAD+) subunit PreA